MLKSTIEWRRGTPDTDWEYLAVDADDMLTHVLIHRNGEWGFWDDCRWCRYQGSIAYWAPLPTIEGS